MRRFLITASLLLLFTAPASAQTVKAHGVELPTQAELGGEQLTLNGAGLRKKFMFKVYVGSLYLQEKTSDADQVLNMEDPNRVRMDLLRDVDQDTLNEAMAEGLQANLTDAEREQFSAEIAQFNGMLDDGKKGDQVFIDYVPGEGIRITHDGRDKGTIANDDFHRPLLKLWIGPNPSDKNLKQGMLGG